ncbi:NAD(P)H:quinone oxidoreductase [Streptomyces marincola]|uniref:NAD(P)H:quinone oxidoreductase n=1 Tax=Streptomyces marincola TaxID=2878388 RepID=UPI001CF479F0|nr:NAD(P)H:quinone oxidoreductase [Streptomyces marincola]UCM89258.1 NAD(P)H:quinone oxidoreductase [Streptomyces marincola]
MSKIAVVVHSLAGSTTTLAAAVAEGAAKESDNDVRLVRVADVRGDEEIAADQWIGKLFSERVVHHPVATNEDLTWADAIILGSGTRFGGMSAAMRKFLEGAAPLWMSGALQGKVGAAFAAASTPHGGMEQTVQDLLTSMMHFGMLLVSPGYADQVQYKASSPYGAVAQAGGPSGLMPTEDDLEAARFLGRLVATTAGRLAPAS